MPNRTTLTQTQSTNGDVTPPDAVRCDEPPSTTINFEGLLQRHLGLIAEYESHLGNVTQVYSLKVEELRRTLRLLEPAPAGIKTPDVLTHNGSRQLSTEDVNARDIKVRVEEVIPPIPTESEMSRHTAVTDPMSMQAVNFEDLWPVWRLPRSVTEADTRDDDLLPTQLAASGTLNNFLPDYMGRFGQNARVIDLHRGLSRCATRVMLRPTSMKRILWDVLSLFVVLYDILTLPLQAFGFEDLSFTSTVNLCILTFWIFDMFMSCISGYIVHGETELRPSRVIHRYALTWFVPDIVMIALDVWYLSSSIPVKGATLGRILKSIRFARILRSVRLLRIVRMKKMFDRLEMLSLQIHTISDKLSEFVGVLKMLFFVLLINHFVACLWYYVGTLQFDGEGWCDVLKLGHISQVELYVVSFHWSLAQFTPAPFNYHPVNYAERMFAIVTLLLGMLVFSSFLGSVTSRLTSIRQRAQVRSHENAMLRQYFKENKVSLELNSRIHDFLNEHRRNHRTPVTVKDIEALKSLPETLQMSLRWEVQSPVLGLHPLFQRLSEWEHPVLADVCYSCTVDKVAGRGDELCHIGEKCRRMFFVCKGFLDYFCGKTHTHHTVQKGQWMSEPVLWVRWRFKGMLTAMRPCDVLEVDAQMFHTVVHMDDDLWLCLRRYALLFLKVTMENQPNDLDEVEGGLPRMVAQAFGNFESKGEEEFFLSPMKDLFSFSCTKS